MRISVLCFGGLGEVAGTKRTMEAEEGATAGDVLEGLRVCSPQLDDLWNRSAIAVNRSYSASTTVLHEGDEIAFLPPVSGGAFLYGEGCK